MKASAKTKAYWTGQRTIDRASYIRGLNVQKWGIGETIKTLTVDEKLYIRSGKTNFVGIVLTDETIMVKECGKNSTMRRHIIGIQNALVRANFVCVSSTITMDGVTLDRWER